MPLTTPCSMPSLSPFSTMARASGLIAAISSSSDPNLRISFLASVNPSALPSSRASRSIRVMSSNLLSMRSSTLVVLSSLRVASLAISFAVLYWCSAISPNIFIICSTALSRSWSSSARCLLASAYFSAALSALRSSGSFGRSASLTMGLGLASSSVTSPRKTPVRSTVFFALASGAFSAAKNTPRRAANLAPLLAPAPTALYGPRTNPGRNRSQNMNIAT
mmetsp:Transcript_1506/g.5706  ORF Transcript_1506/g.5706 Transcript_1506/m.5706 type:complete len:221 (+) Transcript_1506:83-745(+)